MARRVLKRKVPSIPPEMDLTSEFMDPEKVLAANKIQLFYPNAKIYNNLAEYYSHTFLKNDRTKSVKEVTQERNYAWYYSTIGYDPSFGNEYYSQLNKQRNNRKRRRKGKKCASTYIIPCEPMRSEKVVNLKSEYKNYCRRKFPKWFKEFFSSYESILDQDTRPRMSLDEFVVRIMETVHVEDTSSTSLAQNNNGEMQKSTNSRRNVLLKFDKNTDPLSFLKCIIFGKVDINRPLTISVNRKDKYAFELPLPLFAQCPGFVPDASVFLCIDVGAVHDNDNSACETESSGYMSDCSEIDKSDQLLKTLLGSRDLNLDCTKSRNASRLSKQNQTSAFKSVLKAKENVLALENLSEVDVPLPVIKKVEKSKKQSIIVSISRKYITIRSLKAKSAENTQLKENKLPVGCKCNTKILKEVSWRCTCGFYNNAMMEVRKFKIPRKKIINSSTAR